VSLLPEAASSRALLSLVLLLLGTVLAVVALRNRRWEVPAAALAAAGALGWSFTRGAYDGPGLAVVIEGETLQLGDLLWLPAVLLALWLSWRGARR
jgi:hypothetical protein